MYRLYVQGDIDERVVRTVRNIYGLLRSNNTPTELIKPKGKSFFLINGNHRNQDSNTNDDEIERKPKPHPNGIKRKEADPKPVAKTAEDANLELESKYPKLKLTSS